MITNPNVFVKALIDHCCFMHAIQLKTHYCDVFILYVKIIEIEYSLISPRKKIYSRYAT